MTTKKIAITIVAIGWLAEANHGLGQCLYHPPSPRLPVGLSLEIRAAHPVARMSEPVIIHVEVFNKSTTPVSMSDKMWPERDYEIHVYDNKGKEVTLTEWGRKMRAGPIKGSQNTVVLAPGEKLRFD